MPAGVGVMVRGRVRCAAFLVAAVGLLLGAVPAAAQDYAQISFIGGGAQTGVTVRGQTELLYNADYASRAARYLNEMDEAIKRCDRRAYDHAHTNLRALVDVAFESRRRTRQALTERITFSRGFFRPIAIRQELDDLRAELAIKRADSEALVRLLAKAPKWRPCEPRTAQASCGPPGIGRSSVELKGAVGIGGSFGNANYESTGGQAPFSGSFSHTGAQFGGGATFFPGSCVGPALLGFDVGVFSRPGQTFFAIPRHGSGLVTLESASLFVDLLVTGQVPVGPANNWFFTAGLGPTFRHLNFTLRSDQSAFAGGVPSISESTWRPGLAVMGGLSTFACSNCIAGHPLRVGVEGRARFFPSQSISLRSPVFGFTETGSTGRTTDYSVLVSLGWFMR